MMKWAYLPFFTKTDYNLFYYTKETSAFGLTLFSRLKHNLQKISP